MNKCYGFKSESNKETCFSPLHRLKRFWLLSTCCCRPAAIWPHAASGAVAPGFCSWRLLALEPLQLSKDPSAASSWCSAGALLAFLDTGSTHAKQAQDCIVIQVQTIFKLISTFMNMMTWVSDCLLDFSVKTSIQCIAYDCFAIVWKMMPSMVKGPSPLH